MASMFERAFGEGGALGRKMKKAAPIEITYTRGGDSVTLTATYAQQAWASQADGAARVEFAEISFWVEAADLVLGGSQVEPNRGDQIAAMLNGTEMTFELMIPQTREPSWRPNVQRTRMKLNCKRVG